MRHYKRYVFDDQLLNKGLSKEIFEMIFNQLPIGSKIVRWGNEINRAVSFLIVEHGSFPPIREGQEIPEECLSFDKLRVPYFSDFITNIPIGEVSASDPIKPIRFTSETIYERGTYLYEFTKFNGDLFCIKTTKISDTPDVPKQHRGKKNYIYFNQAPFHLEGTCIDDIRVVHMTAYEAKQGELYSFKMGTEEFDKGFELKLKECDCGAEKHGFADHITGCPKKK